MKQHQDNLQDLNNGVDFLNEIRTSPQSAIERLQIMKTFFDGIYFKRAQGLNVETEEGKLAIEDAVQFLTKQKPIKKLIKNTFLQQAAEEVFHVLQNNAYDKIINSLELIVQNSVIKIADFDQVLEYSIVFEEKNPIEAIVNMLIDDGNFKRTKRVNLFNEEIKEIGIANGPHNEYTYCWVYIFADQINPKKQAAQIQNQLIPGAVAVTRKLVPQWLPNGELIMKKFLLYTMKDGSTIYQENVELYQLILKRS